MSRTLLRLDAGEEPKVAREEEEEDFVPRAGDVGFWPEWGTFGRHETPARAKGASAWTFNAYAKACDERRRGYPRVAVKKPVDTLDGVDLSAPIEPELTVSESASSEPVAPEPPLSSSPPPGPLAETSSSNSSESPPVQEPRASRRAEVSPRSAAPMVGDSAIGCPPRKATADAAASRRTRQSGAVAARQAHNLEVGGANPPSDPKPIITSFTSRVLSRLRHAKNGLPLRMLAVEAKLTVPEARKVVLELLDQGRVTTDGPFWKLTEAS